MNRIGYAHRWRVSTIKLLHEVPETILTSYGVEEFGLAEGMALQAGYWRKQIAEGAMRAGDMRASIIPVAHLTSAMIEALLRAVPINQREAEFQQLADESNRTLTGRAHAIILQSGTP